MQLIVIPFWNELYLLVHASVRPGLPDERDSGARRMEHAGAQR